MVVTKDNRHEVWQRILKLRPLMDGQLLNDLMNEELAAGRCFASVTVYEQAKPVVEPFPTMRKRLIAYLQRSCQKAGVGFRSYASGEVHYGDLLRDYGGKVYRIRDGEVESVEYGPIDEAVAVVMARRGETVSV